MEIILNNIKSVDIEKLKENIERIKWIELDFSPLHSLQGNKDLLEKSFKDTKKELI